MTNGHRGYIVVEEVDLRRRVFGFVGVVAVVAVIVSLGSGRVAGQTQKAPIKNSAAVALAADGHPDLSGIWDYRTITPLERPSELAGKEAITDEESADLEAKTVASRNQDRRDGAGTDADVARAYNDFWWDFGKKVIKN